LTHRRAIAEPRLTDCWPTARRSPSHRRPSAGRPRGDRPATGDRLL